MEKSIWFGVVLYLFHLIIRFIFPNSNAANCYCQLLLPTINYKLPTTKHFPAPCIFHFHGFAAEAHHAEFNRYAQNHTYFVG